MSRSAKSPSALSTLSFALTGELMGEVYVYPLPEEFSKAWARLPKPRSLDAQRPTASLATAARAVTGRRLVFTDPERPPLTGPWTRRALIVTSEPLDFTVWRRLVREWEGRLTGWEGQDTLSQYLLDEAGGPYPLQEVLHRDREGRITGPNWAFRVASWRLAQLLRREPWEVDALAEPLALVLESEGDLLTWAQPMEREASWIDAATGERRRRVGHAMDRIHIDVDPAPGGRTLVAHLEARTARIATGWYGVKNAHVCHPANPDIVLKAPVHLRWTKDEHGQWTLKSAQYKGATAQIVEACGIAPLPDPFAVDFDKPGPVRGIHTTAVHPIGKGAGSRLMRRLEEHASRMLDATPLTYTGSGVRVPRLSPEPSPVVAPDKILPAVVAAGFQALRIVALYETGAWKERVLAQLARDFAQPDVEALKDGHTIVLAPGLQLMTVRVPELVRHGPHNRAPVLNGLSMLRPCDPGELVAALVETSLPARGEADAKAALKPLFADRDIPSQFLTMASLGDLYQPNLAEKIARSRAAKNGQEPPPVTRKEDAAAQIATGGLLTDCGVIDDRLAAAACHPLARDTALDRRAWLVGLWTRLHRFPRIRGRATASPVLAVTLVALKASHHQDERYWPALMYSGQRWLPLAYGRTRHHAGPIGLPGHHLRDETGGPARVRDHVEQALAQLPGDLGVVVFTEQHRDLWPGLANPTLGDGLLPGLTLAARGRDVAVVRVTHGSRTPRPTHRAGGSSKRPGDADKAAMPEKILYVSDHGGVNSWLFAAETRQHKGGQRTGTDYTRRTLPETSQSKLGTDFHAITRTEYTIARAGAWQEERLVGLAARLSQQSASWSGRTLLPLPLHLARNADEKHPQYVAAAEDEEIEQS
ncbi:hypothetical protein M2163_001163 [Streptomyces sp. SAI-135]|uniref:RNaseH domain-containing protein n=2 Tax=Streptomyces TaxID=1883 RepID=UPI0024750A3F|nr:MULTISPECIES: RNaseH domain-containing protein [unclassified Streptomyces]MDH6521844.1 hypothetical protein [Streptomyces sp. SAI-090]MDH6614055.1 hypothetical protein [Streptomyces sp. SAI-135]